MRVPVSALIPGQSGRTDDQEDPGDVSTPSGSHGVGHSSHSESAMDQQNRIPSGSMWSDSSSAAASAGPMKAEPDDDSQPVSWQLGGLPSIGHFASSSGGPSQKHSNVKEEMEESPFKIPSEIPAKRRGRPPTKNPPAPPGGKVPAIKKPRLKVNRKTRRKRLTMPRNGRPVTQIRKPAIRPVPPVLTGIPSNHNLTEDERTIRLDALCENCPEELARNIRFSSAVIEEIYKEAEECRLSMKSRDLTLEQVEAMQEEFSQEKKSRLALDDQEEIALTQSICEQVMAIRLRKEEHLAGKKSTFFRNGPSDEEFQKTRALLMLPPVEKQHAPEDYDKNSADFFHAVGLPTDFATGTYTVDDLKINSSVHTVGVNIAQGADGSPGNVCNFSTRPHPKDLSQQLYSLLGKSVLPKAEKRAVQRAKKAAQNENMTEDRIELACFDYLKTCATHPFGDFPVISPPYHRLSDTPVNPEASALELYEKFVNSCSCKGGSRCDVCRNAPPTKARLPAATNVAVPSHALVYDYCFLCEQAYQLDFEFAKIQHPRHKNDEGAPFPLGSFYLWPDFLNVEDEPNLIRCINARGWMEGDTGCRRQDYGPSVNYHAQRVNVDKFTGLPPFSQILIQKMSRWNRLSGFLCAGLSNVELTKERVAAVQARVEDEWMWGDRVAVLSLNSDTVLTFSPRNWDRKEVYRPVRVQIPRRSLVVITGEARHNWNYSVLSADVSEKQIMMVFRELGKAFLEGGPQASTGKRILDVAQTYLGKIMKNGKGL